MSDDMLTIVPSCICMPPNIVYELSQYLGTWFYDNRTKWSYRPSDKWKYILAWLELGRRPRVYTVMRDVKYESSTTFGLNS